MLVKNVIITMKAIILVSQKNVQLVDVIRMLIGLTDIFASPTRMLLVDSGGSNTDEIESEEENE